MKYILMHRETAVAVLSINDISGTVYRVDDVMQPAHLTTDRQDFGSDYYIFRRFPTWTA